MYDETNFEINGLTESDLYFVIEIPLQCFKRHYVLNLYGLMKRKNLLTLEHKEPNYVYILISYLTYFREIPVSLRHRKEESLNIPTWNVIDLIYNKERNFNYDWWKRKSL